MPAADANRYALSIRAESSFNETPGTTPNLTLVRTTGESLVEQPEFIESDEIRADANVAGVTKTFEAAAGGFRCELTYDAIIRTLIQAFMRGTWSAPSSLSITGTASTDVITTGSAHNLVPGDIVTLTALSGGAGLTASATTYYFVNTTPSSTTLTLNNGSAKSAIDFTTNISSGTLQPISTLKNGTTQRSFFIEKKFSDLTKFLGYRGSTPDTMKLIFEAKKNVMVEFGFKCARGVSTSSSYATTTDAAGTSPIMACGVNVGGFFIDGVASTEAIKKLEIEVALGARERDVVDSAYTAQHGYSEVRITATLQVYLQGLTLHDAMRANTPVALEWTVGGLGTGTGLFLFKIPSLVLRQSNPQATGKNTDVMATLQGTAVYNSTDACAMRIGRIDGV